MSALTKEGTLYQVRVTGVIANTRNCTLEHDGLHISDLEYAVSSRIAQVDDTVIPRKTPQPVPAAGFIAP